MQKIDYSKGYFEFEKGNDGKLYFTNEAPNHKTVMRFDKGYDTIEELEIQFEKIRINSQIEARFIRFNTVGGKPIFSLVDETNDIIGVGEDYESEAAREKGIKAAMKYGTTTVVVNEDTREQRPKKDKMGPKFYIDIEGTIHPWTNATITVEQIIALAGWDANQEVLTVNLQTNDEEALKAGQIVHLTSSIAFSKKIKFQRGKS